MQTAQILHRFEKFFNLNQNEESREEDIDFTDATYTLKVDGSLVSPVLFPGGDIFWMSRKTRIEEVENFISSDEIVNSWVYQYLEKGITPLLEWCTPHQTVGVIAAKKKSLTLLALRKIDTGQYLPLPPKETIPFPLQLVSSLVIDDLADVRNWKDQEGVVISIKGKKYK